MYSPVYPSASALLGLVRDLRSGKDSAVVADELEAYVHDMVKLASQKLSTTSSKVSIDLLACPARFHRNALSAASDALRFAYLDHR